MMLLALWHLQWTGICAVSMSLFFSSCVPLLRAGGHFIMVILGFSVQHPSLWQ